MPEECLKGEELAYALVTPYTLHKSRTGGILARLLWANVRLAAVRMYAPAPDSDFIRQYCDGIYDPEEKRVPLRYQKLLIRYVLENFGYPNARGISNRMLLVIFRGENAQHLIEEAAGHIGQDVRGDDVRGTYGDFIQEDWSADYVQKARERAEKELRRYPALQEVEHEPEYHRFFEPAVLTGVTPEMTESHLRLFSRNAYSDGGYVLRALPHINEPEVETSMVILKPESFRRRNPLPGNLLDFFARTGMFITGAKMVSLTVEQASRFYAAKLPQFREQLKAMVGGKAEDIMEKARRLSETVVSEVDGIEQMPTPAQAIRLAHSAEMLFARDDVPEPGQIKADILARACSLLEEKANSFHPDPSLFDEIAEELKELNAQAEFDELIRYMTGVDVETGKPIEPERETQCMALLYSGPDALRVIRQRLRELREVYGQNVLQNRAHASDPEEDPVQETEILGMPNAPEGETKPCDVCRLVEACYEV
ncbi:MAG: hypothetical protein ACLFWL_00590 [Candidatus Brocadiia bacterium]